MYINPKSRVTVKQWTISDTTYSITVPKQSFDLPPTSRLTRDHIQRAVYGAHMQIHCLDNPQIDPNDFGFYEQDGLLRLVRDQILLPDDFPMPCKCTACAMKCCSCRKLDIRCCPDCKCQTSDKGCKNLG